MARRADRASGGGTAGSSRTEAGDTGESPRIVPERAAGRRSIPRPETAVQEPEPRQTASARGGEKDATLRRELAVLALRPGNHLASLRAEGRGTPAMPRLLQGAESKRRQIGSE